MSSTEPPQREAAHGCTEGDAAAPASPGRILLRGVLIVAGVLCVALGALGVIIPVLPTTPFLLVAALCFAHASPRLHRWLLENRLFGRYLRDYTAGAGLSPRARAVALVLLWTTIGASAWLVVPPTQGWLRILLLAIALGVTIHLLRLRRTPHD